LPAENNPRRVFNRLFAWLTTIYTGGVGFLLRNAVIGIIGFVAVLGATYALFQRIPGSLVPAEDQGYVFMVTILPPAAAIARTREVTKEATAAVMKNPAVAHVVTFSGFDLLSRALKTNSGISFVTLKDWSQRKAPAEDARNIAPALARINANFKDGIVIGFNPPPIIGISVTGGFEFFLQDRSGGPLTGLGEAVSKVVAAANQRPELRGVQTTFTTATATRRVRSAFRSTPSSTPCRARSAVSTSTTSRCSGGPIASACRQRPTIARSRTTCATCSCAPTTTSWCR
jgi:multidrug efflux pump